MRWLGRLFCSWGWHKKYLVNLDGTETGPWMSIGDLYKAKCSRRDCGFEEPMVFHIDRS